MDFAKTMDYDVFAVCFSSKTACLFRAAAITFKRLLNQGFCSMGECLVDGFMSSK